jgi:hypothetical protein
METLPLLRFTERGPMARPERRHLGLERGGLRVVAAPIPLTSLADDTAAVKRAIARTQGPVVLVSGLLPR